MHQNEFEFHLGDFSSVCRLRLPKYVSGDREANSLLVCEIQSDKLVRCTAKVIYAVRAILPYVDFPIGVGDFVNNIHLKTRSKVLLSL
jgi:hypothetical protein